LPRNDPYLLTHLVAALSQSLNEDGLRSLLAEAGHHAAAAVGGGWPVSAASRRSLAHRFLDASGYLPRWEEAQGETHLHFGHCPYSPLAQAQPNLCAFDEALMARLLGRRIRIARRIALFEPECVFLVGRGAAFDSLLSF
jgi:predicted ArsR family transcriptional regulator